MPAGKRRRGRSRLLVRAGIPRTADLEPRDLRHERHDGGPPDTALRDARHGDEPRRTAARSSSASTTGAPSSGAAIIDLSYAAARVLGIVGPGTARVRLVRSGRLPGDGGTDVRGVVWIQVGAFTVQENGLRPQETAGHVLPGRHRDRPQDRERHLFTGSGSRPTGNRERLRGAKAWLRRPSPAEQVIGSSSSPNERLAAATSGPALNR